MTDYETGRGPGVGMLLIVRQENGSSPAHRRPGMGCAATRHAVPTKLSRVVYFQLDASRKGDHVAESMAVEDILEADLQLRGFWTRVRFPLRTSKGGWSDIDVLAYNPETRELVVAESKVRGPKKHVYAFTPRTQATYGSILEYDGDNYFGFLRHIGRACADGVIFENFAKMVRVLTVHLVSNYYIAPECMAGACGSVLKRIRPSVPKSVKLSIKLETTLDVIARIITGENLDAQGRRYGHAALDIARELNRYLHPNILFAGRGRGSTDAVKKALAKTLQHAFRVNGE
jgi:hypothetical protein